MIKRFVTDEDLQKHIQSFTNSMGNNGSASTLLSCLLELHIRRLAEAKDAPPPPAPKLPDVPPGWAYLRAAKNKVSIDQSLCVRVTGNRSVKVHVEIEQSHFTHLVKISDEEAWAAYHQQQAEESIKDMP